MIIIFFEFQIDQGGLSLPTPDYYLNKTEDDEILTAPLMYMTQAGVLLGGDDNATRTQMKIVTELETTIATVGDCRS